MRKFILVLVLLTAAVFSSYAHSLMAAVNSNGDGTATVYGYYSTGADAVRTPVRLIGPDEKVLAEGKTDEGGEWTYTIPSVPYDVFVDAGAGHQVRETGVKE